MKLSVETFAELEVSINNFIDDILVYIDNVLDTLEVDSDIYTINKDNDFIVDNEVVAKVVGIIAQRRLLLLKVNDNTVEVPII